MGYRFHSILVVNQIHDCWRIHSHESVIPELNEGATWVEALTWEGDKVTIFSIPFEVSNIVVIEFQCCDKGSLLGDVRNSLFNFNKLNLIFF